MSPPNLGLNLDIPEVATRHHISSIRRNHDKLLEEFTTYDQANKALKSITIATFEEVHIRALRNKHIGYANFTTHDIIRHLYDACASISAQDLSDNDEHLKSPYDPNLPFETLIDQVENAVKLDADGKSPNTRTQIVNAV